MSEIARIAVNSGVKKIQVNDEGEYITLNMGDQAFIPALLALMRDFETVAEQHTDRAAEIDRMPNGTPKESMEKITAVAAFNLEICNTMKARLDDTFHDEVCRKVFGNITPGLTEFAEFFDQLGTLIKQFGDERFTAAQKRIEKYTAKYHK